MVPDGKSVDGRMDRIDGQNRMTTPKLYPSDFIVCVCGGGGGGGWGGGGLRRR